MSLFRSLPLRTKLIAAFAVPMLVLMLFAALQVSRSANEAQDSQAQLDQVDRVVVFTELAVILSNEYDAQLQFGTTAAQQLAVRGRSDIALNRLIDEGDSFGFEPAELTEVKSIRSELHATREVLGDDPRPIASDASDQIEQGLDLDQPESLLGALVALDGITQRAIDLIDIDDDVLIDPTTAVSLQSLRQGLQLDSAVRSEGLNYILLSQLSSAAVTDQLVALQTANRADSQLLERQLVSGGDAEAQAQLEALVSSEAWTDFLAIRSRVAQVGPGESVAFDTPVVSAAFAEVSAGLDALAEESINELFSVAYLRRADANREQAWTLAAAFAVLGFISLVLFSFYRSISKPIVSLTRRSLEIAEVELPAIVSLMRTSGVGADVPEIEPIERMSDDEVGELVTAFNGMHQTAVTLAAEQAGSRHTVGDMFVNLGRRNQKLLLRMLGELDVLEGQERDPDRLDALYRVDRLATRMRRNAESLLVLAGAQSARRVGQPVPFSEVARSAVSEVEQFDRVKIAVQGDAMVDGAVVVDIAHLLAELIENGLDSSPADSIVDVIVVSTRSKHRIAVRDRGLGMSPEQLQDANALIRNAANAEESPSKQLGLFVVGRLAARHGIAVRLAEDAGSGIAAVIDLPDALIVGDSEVPERDLQQVTAPRVSRIPAAVSKPESPPLPAPAPAAAAPAAAASVTASPAPAPSTAGLADPATQPHKNASAAPQPQPAQLATAASGRLPQRTPNETGFGTTQQDAGTPQPQTKSTLGSLTAVRRTPGANLPQGVEPVAVAVESRPVKRPSAEALSSSLGSFQRGTNRAASEKPYLPTPTGEVNQ